MSSALSCITTFPPCITPHQHIPPHPHTPFFQPSSYVAIKLSSRTSWVKIHQYVWRGIFTPRTQWMKIHLSLYQSKIFTLLTLWHFSKLLPQKHAWFLVNLWRKVYCCSSQIEGVMNFLMNIWVIFHPRRTAKVLNCRPLRYVTVTCYYNCHTDSSSSWGTYSGTSFQKPLSNLSKMVLQEGRLGRSRDHSHWIMKGKCFGQEFIYHWSVI